jgi:GNAT superfamily N-acetyltransferase
MEAPPAIQDGSTGTCLSATLLSRGDPARHPLVLRQRTGDGGVVGWGEVLEDHPRDGVPWLGLLEVHQLEQRKGYGSEALAALLEWARSVGAPALR